MADIILGNLKFYWAGDWQASFAYDADDVVKYGPNVYVCTIAHTSSTFAADEAKWDLMVAGLENAGEWNGSTLYKFGQTVTYGGAVYIALRESTNANPYTSSSDWQKFVDGQQFEGEWSVSTTYQKGDIVSYGGYLYVAKQNSTSFNPTNTVYFDVFSKGVKFVGEWTALDQYKPGDIVNYGGYRYVVTQGNRPQTDKPSESGEYEKIFEGYNFKGLYSDTEEYVPGDVVKRGSYIYECIVNSVGELPEDSIKFRTLVEGLLWRGSWDVDAEYAIGDVVIYGGSTYVCITSHASDTSTITYPENGQYWDRFTSGMNWSGVWDSGTLYKVDDVVEYAQSSYISRINDNSNNQPDLDDGTNWQLVAQGDSNAVLASQGDLLYRSALQAERLPIGPSGSFLYSDGVEPKWGHITPQRDFYVSLEGDDTNDGRTPTSSFRTIKRAAEVTYNLGQCRINVTSGTYDEQCPIRVGRSVVLEGNGLGAVTISPNTTRDEGFGVGISDDGSTPNVNSYVFHMNNGARMRNFVFRGFSEGSVLVSLDPGTGPDDTSVWITSQSPYVQNCTSFTPGGTGFKIDGALHNGGYKSMVANDWTQINSDGIGIHVLNDGRSEIVSCFTYYCNIGYLAESGGKIRAIVGNNSYGEYGAVARGYSQLETPLTGSLRLDADTINSVQSFSSNLHIFTSYRDEQGNLFVVGHTSPTAGDVTSTFDNTASVPVVARYNSAGALQWVYSYTSGFGAIHNVVEQGDSIYVGGVIYDGSNKGLIIKLSKSGEIQWQKTVGNTTEIVDITTDTNYIYAVGNHTTAGTSVVKLNPAGIEDWSRTLNYSGGSANTVKPSSVTFAGPPTTSVDTYENSGDATAEGNLYISGNDSNTGNAIIWRVSQVGNLVTTYEYPNLKINKLRLDTGNGDGIYLVAGGSYDPTGTATDHPLIFRINLQGVVQWQTQLEGKAGAGENGVIKDVLPFGNAVYACGYINENSNGNNTGFIIRLESNGTYGWDSVITNGSNDIGLYSIALDGVNVISAGIEDTNGVIINIQRDQVNGIGTVTTGSYVLDNNQMAVTSNTVASWTDAESNTTSSSVALGVTATSLVLEQEPGITLSVNATRDGFAGIGTGTTFEVSNLGRRPKEGSVLQIAGDSETYFVIGVDNFIENFGVLSDNNPNAVASLTNNRTWIQQETIGWITDQIANATGGSIWDGFTYDAVKCERDVGLIVDALITDLDSSTIGSFEQNDASIDAALSYWSGYNILVAGQEDQTVAAINYMKGLVDNAMNKTSPAQTYTAQVQDTSHSAIETGSDTFAADRVDIVTDVISNGPAAAPTLVASGTATITLDPAIPSNKTPDDDTDLTFREAFSQVRMSGHDFLDIGTGGFADTNYPVIIASDYPQTPNQNRETLAELGGRVFYVTTDQDGNFRVGDYFKVEQSTGRATLSSEEFDLAGLNELQLGSITAGKTGATINEFSTDGTFADNSDTAVPTERATKTYVDQQISVLSETAGKIVAGEDPTQSKVEVIGTGASTDTIDFQVAGALRGQFGDQYVLVPAGDTNSRPDPLTDAVDGMIRYNTTINAFEGFVNGSWTGIGGGNPWITKTGPYTALNNDRIFVDTLTAGSNITITLPLNPNPGDNVRFLDIAGSFGPGSALIVNPNGENINGQSGQTLEATTPDAGFQMIYTGATYGWKLLEI
jgi:hypothetical protein